MKRPKIFKTPVMTLPAFGKYLARVTTGKQECFIDMLKRQEGELQAMTEADVKRNAGAINAATLAGFAITSRHITGAINAATLEADIEESAKAPTAAPQEREGPWWLKGTSKP